MSAFNDIIKEATEQIRKYPRTCEICGDKETVHNVMLYYDNGYIMCDACAIRYYENEERMNCEDKGELK